MKPLLVLLSLPALLFAQDSTDYPKGSIERLDPALNDLIAADVKIEKLAEGFNWSEGPTWYKGAIIFSDVPENTVFRWAEGMKKAEVFIKPSGMLTEVPGFREKGSNGLTTDAKGTLVLAQHGERRIARWVDEKFVVVADKFEGKRFNSPNDVIVAKNGDIYFTDPPYGFSGGDGSPLKEQPFHGVYRVTPDGTVTVVNKEIRFPNGIALSPDEKTLYIGVSDGGRGRIEAADRAADGTISNWRTFFTTAAAGKPELRGGYDGMKVDAQGNLWSTGPGGVLIITPQAKLLGRILTGQQTGNCGWGDDGSSLYICADMFLLRVKTKTKGSTWKN